MKAQALQIKERPAFHVDKKLKDAARKAALVFEKEKEELKQVMIWKNFEENGY